MKQAELAIQESAEVQRPASGMELLAELARKTNDPQAAVEIAKQIVDLQVRQEELRQSRDRFDWEKKERESKIAFAQAFERFKAECPKILKTKHVKFPNKTGGETEYWHVELDKACDVLIPALLKEGLTHRWKSTDLPGGFTRVTCFIRHRLGYEEEGATLAGPADQSGGKNPIQGVGSTNMYLERYTFLATIGIVPAGTDNDGSYIEEKPMEEGRLADLKAAIEGAGIRTGRYEAAVKGWDEAATDRDARLAICVTALECAEDRKELQAAWATFCDWFKKAYQAGKRLEEDLEILTLTRDRRRGKVQ